MHTRSASNTNEINWDDPLNKGLVAWYPMRQKGGNVLRDVAGGHDGTLNGLMTSDDWVASPETNSLALDFDGIDDGVNTNWNFSAGRGNFTLATWMKPASADLSGYSMLIGKDVAGQRDWAFGIGGYTPGRLFFISLSPSDTDAAELVSSSFAAGVWYHVVMSFTNGTTPHLFIDGFRWNTRNAGSGNGSWSPDFTATNDVFIGQREFSTFENYFSGSISDTRIYNRALSESEVHDLYQASRTGYVNQFKRRYFPVSLQTEEPPTETATSGLIRLKSPKQTQPSYKAGYAKSASESASPKLWDGLKSAWVPSLGNTGLRVRDVVGSNDGDSHSSTIWEENGLRYVLNSGDRGTTCGPDRRLINLPEISIALRFKANAASDGRPLSIFSKITDINECAFDFRLLDDRSSIFVVERATVRNRTPTPSGTFVPGEWYDVVCTFNRGTTHCIVNGELIATESGGPLLNTSLDADVCIGDNKRPNIYTFDGVVQAAMVWDRALTQDDARELHADPLAPFRQRRYAPFSLTTEEPPTTFNHWYALPGRINRFIGLGVHV